MASTNAAVTDALKGVLLSNVQTVHTAPKKVVCLKLDHTLEHALSTLAVNNIFSAPVFEGTTCIGIIDCLDIVEAVMKKVDQAQGAQDANAAGLAGIDSMEYIRRPPEYWLNMAGKLALNINKTREALQIERRDPYTELKDSATPSLFSVIEHFAKGIHRVVVVNDESRILRVVSQSAAIAHIAGHPELLGDVGSRTIAATGISPRVKVIKVPGHLAAMDAFRLLSHHQISGIAVIDDDGRLCGVLEASDLKRLTAASIQDLTHPILEFLATRRRGVKKADWAFSAKEEDTLQQTLVNFYEHHVHRLFITDKLRKPIGIISFSDICAYVIGVPRPDLKPKA